MAGTTLLDFWSAQADTPDPTTVMGALAEVGVACWIGTADDPVDWRAALRAFHRPVEVGRLACVLHGSRRRPVCSTW